MLKIEYYLLCYFMLTKYSLNIHIRFVFSFWKGHFL